ncbi:potassium channel family protein [Methanogenium organophilum]|uniref:NAD-binding protein n=1 Tax=Methanogenium organophilum TaxID=2199 RepID=A0A9X9S628_METOG|nr:NAD-binding protein [Methanogenium organophilum]WAI02137.1 NAD-binding protein [Methanogenium organophilum]
MKPPERLRHIMQGAVPQKRLRIYVSALVAQIIIYALLIYLLIPLFEGYTLTPLESLYFVVMTISTVGYGLTFPIESDFTHLLVIIIIVCGVTTVLFIIPALLGPYLERAFRAGPPRRTTIRPDGHTIVVGFNEVTRSLIHMLSIAENDIILVEENEERAKAALRMKRDIPQVIWGEYNEDETWKNAWIAKADYVIIDEEEHTAAKIILGITSMTDAKIITIVEDITKDRFLRYAGSEYILSPKNVTGKSLARYAIPGPFFETIYDENPYCTLQSAETEESGDDGDKRKIFMLPVLEAFRFVGHTVGDINQNDEHPIEIVSYWKGHDFVMYPDESEVIDKSMILFVHGVEGDVHATLDESIAPGKGDAYAVIVGFGHIGRTVYRELEEIGIHATVIESRGGDIPGIHGSGESEADLIAAGITHASVCIIATSDDDVNIFSTLMARTLNQKMRVLSVATEPESVEKLYRAGADYVVDLPTHGAILAANIVLADLIHLILDLPGEEGREIAAKHIMNKVPLTVDGIETQSGVKVIGFRGRHKYVIHPEKSQILMEGDEVIVIGSRNELKTFIRITSSGE